MFLNGGDALSGLGDASTRKNRPCVYTLISVNLS